MARNMRTESNDETEVAIIASSVHPAGSRRGRKTFFGPEIIFFLGIFGLPRQKSERGNRESGARQNFGGCCFELWRWVGAG